MTGSKPDDSSRSTDEPLNLESLSLEAKEFQTAQKSDESLKDLWESIGDNDSRYEAINGFLYKKSTYKDEDTNQSKPRLVVPQQYKKQLLHLAHDSLWAGHRGVHATKSKLSTDFTWNGLDADVKNYIKHVKNVRKMQ